MKKLIPLILILIAFSSCRYFGHNRIDGNGQVKTENRTVSKYSSVEVSSNIDLYITQDTVCSLALETDDNLFTYIETRVEGDVLKISTREGYSLDGSKGIKAHLHVQQLKSLSSSGSCDINGQNPIVSTSGMNIDASGSTAVKMDITASKVTASFSGSGKLELKGQVKDFEVEGSGSTEVICPGLNAENVSLEISGSGSADVSASAKLTVDISGSGEVKYHGNPELKQSVSGSGSVTKVQ